MAIVRYVEAINQALKEEMRRDERVVLWGEDLISMNGVMGQTRGIYEEFGGDRIKDTPICEQAITGMAMGAAMRGLRPVGFFMNAGFSLVAFDGMFFQLGCNSGARLPVVMYGVISGLGDDNGHGMSPEALYMHAPYLKIVMPSTPYDAKGLMKTAIRDDRPVLFWDHNWCYFMGYKDGQVMRTREAASQEIPDEEYLIPFGKADIKRNGTDITIITYSFMVHYCLAAAFNLAKEGINAEVIDLRTIVPLDVEAVTASVRKTGRLLIVHEAMKRGGSAGEIAFRVFEKAPELLKTLKAPFRRLASKNLPMVPAFAPMDAPTPDSIAATVREMVKK